MNLQKIFLTLLLVSVALFSEAQDKERSHKLITEVNVNYGHLRWIEKLFIDDNNNVDGDPVIIGKNSYTYTGKNREYNINLHYTIKNFGFGLYLGQSFLDVQPTNDLIFKGPAYNKVTLFGALVNFEAYRFNDFSIAPEIKGGTYVIWDKYNEFYEEKVYINAGVKLTYSLNRINLNLKPNYSFMSSENYPYSWLEIREFKNIFNISFGAGIDIIGR